jgi:hypothetical protein
MDGQVLVTYTCNPSYSGGRDQEDCGLKPAWGIVLKTLFLKNPSHKRTGGVAQGVGSEFKPQYCGGGKKRKKTESYSVC